MGEIDYNKMAYCYGYVDGIAKGIELGPDPEIDEYDKTITFSENALKEHDEKVRSEMIDTLSRIIKTLQAQNERIRELHKQIKELKEYIKHETY